MELIFMFLQGNPKGKSMMENAQKVQLTKTVTGSG
jgi:hypothetical protein